MLTDGNGSSSRARVHDGHGSRFGGGSVLDTRTFGKRIGNYLLSHKKSLDPRVLRADIDSKALYLRGNSLNEVQNSVSPAFAQIEVVTWPSQEEHS